MSEPIAEPIVAPIAEPIIEPIVEPNTYANGKIYKIVSSSTEDIYIGSTCSMLAKRHYQHKNDLKRFKSGKGPYISSFEIIKYDDSDIILIENFACNTKEELHAREHYHIKANKCVNKSLPGRTRKQYREDNREKIAEHKQEYALANREKIAEHKKSYYLANREDNREKRAEYQKEYCLTNREKLADRQKSYYLANREKIAEHHKAYNLANKDKNAAYDKQRHANKTHQQPTDST